MTGRRGRRHSTRLATRHTSLHTIIDILRYRRDKSDSHVSTSRAPHGPCLLDNALCWLRTHQALRDSEPLHGQLEERKAAEDDGDAHLELWQPLAAALGRVDGLEEGRAPAWKMPWEIAWGLHERTAGRQLQRMSGGRWAV